MVIKQCSGVSPVISLELYRSVVCRVLEYGTTSVYINRLDKLQYRFVKQCLGLITPVILIQS